LTTARDHFARVRTQNSAETHEKQETLAWESLVRVLLRTNEFVYLD